MKWLLQRSSSFFDKQTKSWCPKPSSPIHNQPNLSWVFFSFIQAPSGSRSFSSGKKTLSWLESFAPPITGHEVTMQWFTVARYSMSVHNIFTRRSTHVKCLHHYYYTMTIVYFMPHQLSNFTNNNYSSVHYCSSSATYTIVNDYAHAQYVEVVLHIPGIGKLPLRTYMR